MIVDMSPNAITERLRLASQLAALCLALGKARMAGTTSNTDPRAQNTSPANNRCTNFDTGRTQEPSKS